MAVVVGAGDRHLHAERVAEIPRHVEVERRFRVADEGHLGVQPLLRGRADLRALEPGDRGVGGDARELAQPLHLGRRARLRQPGVVLRRQQVVVVRRRRVEAEPQAVLVEDLDDRDRRLVPILGLRVGIDVREDLPRVVLLQLDQARVVERHPLRPADLVEVLHAVPGLVRPADVQVQIDVDPALLELGHEEVEAVELARVEAPAVTGARGDDPARGVEVDEVQAHHVHPVARECAGPHRDVFLRRQQDRASAPVGEMHPPEAEPSAVPPGQMAVPDAHEPVLARRRIQQERHVGRRGARRAMIDRERLQQTVVPPLCGGRGRQQGQEDERAKHAKSGHRELGWTRQERHHAWHRTG